MDILRELIAACQCEVSVTVNEHRNDYITVEDWFSRQGDGALEDTGADVYAEMVKRNVTVRVTAYSSTPVGFYCAFHYDVEMALMMVLNAVKEHG